MEKITIKTTATTIDLGNLVKVYTHGGSFHADDVCTVALIEILKGAEIEVRRVFGGPWEDVDPTYSIAFDVGGGEFDHHSEPRETYEDGCPMAAFGKVARAISIDGQSLEEIYPGFTQYIAKPIEARDNGYASDKIKDSYFAEIVNPFGTLWDKTESPDDQFRIAVNIVKPILSRQLDSLLSKKNAKSVIESAPVIGRVVVLDQFAPWQDYIDENVLGAVFPSNRGGWNVQLAGIPGKGFERKADFMDLLKDSGLTTFVHPAGFICACNTKEEALQVIDYIVERPFTAE